MPREPTAAKPDISVIVPARNAAATIGDTLAALADQEFDGSYEVVVVDDASNDETPRLAEGAGARLVRHGAPTGPARARNAGVAAARGSQLAFTDADCEPTPGWLAAGAGALRRADLVQGAVSPPPDADIWAFDRLLRIDERSPRLWETANLFVRRDTFDRLGGFVPFSAEASERVGGIRPTFAEGHFGEDAYFGWRAVRGGARAVFCPRALVHHAVFRRGPRAFIAERWRLRYFPALVRDLPELRDQFYLGVFLSRRTARFDLALSGALCALVTRRRAPLLAAAPYLATSFRETELWRRSAWRENLVRAVADAVSLGALVCGSVAARRLLL